MNKDLYLIDGSGFIFRAYHALPPLTRPDGTPVGAVLGFTNMLVRLLKDRSADHVAVVFDAARKTFRQDIYPDYKAHRPPPPEDLVPQFPLIREAARAFGLPALEQEGFEADDLIASYARVAVAAGFNVIIVSSDKDLMQLIRPGVALMDPLKYTLLGEEAVIEKFGVPPDKVVEVQSLCGDAVDNVPGVPGIGVKTAAQLIAEYGDLETLLSRAGEIKQPKRRENLIEFADQARVSRRLVQLAADAPLPVPLDDIHVAAPDSQRLGAWLEQQGFRNLLHRLGLAAGASLPPLPPPDTPSAPPATPVLEYILINDRGVLADWIARAKEAGIVAVDTETTSLTPARAKLVGVSLCITPGQAAYIPLGHDSPRGDLLNETPAQSIPQLPLDLVMADLRPLFEDPAVLKIGHNIKYDLQMFAAQGISVAPVDDTMLMSYALDSSAHGHGLEELAKVHLGRSTTSYDAVTGTGKARKTFDQVDILIAKDYAAEDADLTRALYDLFKPRLLREKMTAVYEDIDRPILPVIATMERTGIHVDPALLRSLSGEFGVQLQALETEIHRLAGHPFNVASPKQLGGVLFDEMGLTGSSRTKTGDWSTSSDILEALAEQGHTIVEKVLDWRQLAKLKSTYTDALLDQINPATGRIHTSYSLAGTSTGRLSSSDPNLQNIPIRTEQGRKIRKAFVTDPGWTLISVDYSQIELRLVAEMAGIKALQDAFRNGEDIHATTASQVFGVPLDQMTPDIRRQAKAINFGIIYGISGFGLARQLGVEPGVAASYIRQYFARFPELATYFERAKDEARVNGFVKTLLGRKCTIEGIKDKNAARRAFAERQAINAPVQGTAADLMKIAMGRLPSALVAAGLSARLLLQVHDELVLEAPEGEAQKTAEITKAVMEGVAPHLALRADAGIGPNWDDAH